jgi:hypothetical protein
MNIHDLGGNVMEWTMTPYQEQKDFFTVKGGAWFSSPYEARGSNQTPGQVEYRVGHIGFRCVIDDNAIVHEVGPQTFKAELRQIRRRVALTIPVLFHYYYMLLNPRYGWFGMLIFPIRRMLAVLSPLIQLYVICYFLWWDWRIAAAMGLIGVAAIAVTGKYYPFIQQIGIVLGWYDVLTAKVRASAQWEKVN